MAAPNVEKLLEGKIVLMTGATRLTRSIGGPTAVELARLGATVVTPHLGEVKERFAEEVVEKGVEVGGLIIPLKIDLTDESQRMRAVNYTGEKFGKIDLLIHSASGGLGNSSLEAACALNTVAQIELTREALHLMPPGSKVLTLPSFGSFFYGKIPQLKGYENTAKTKHEGEIGLLKMKERRERGILLR